jgi:transcriptional regulator with XRE-family HTH domain
VAIASSNDEKRVFRHIFAEELRKALKDLNLNQEAACRELEITRATLSAWLNEHATPDAVLLAKAFVKLELHLDCFHGRLIGIGSGRRVTAQEPKQSELFL